MIEIIQNWCRHTLISSRRSLSFAISLHVCVEFCKSCVFKQNNPRESGAFLKPYSLIERNAQTTEIIGFIFIYVWAVCGYRPTNNWKRRIHLLHPLQLQVSGNMKIWILILNFKTYVSWCFNKRCECRYDNAQCLTHSQYKDVCMMFWIR